MWSHGALRVSRALLSSVSGLPGPGASAPFLWQRPFSFWLPGTRVGSEQERAPVMGWSTAARLGKAIEEAPCASDAGKAREVPLFLGNRNCCHGRSCIRKGCIACLRKSLGLFLARDREELGLQLGNGLLGKRAVVPGLFGNPGRGTRRDCLGFTMGATEGVILVRELTKVTLLVSGVPKPDLGFFTS